jgi:hypothetical protein
MKSTDTKESPTTPEVKRPSILEARRLAEYARRHHLSADALRVVTYLHLNGAQEPESIIAETGIGYPKFFKALCNASGVLIFHSRALRVDVNLTSRRAIDAIPESALTLQAPVTNQESKPVATVKVDPMPVATVHHEPEHEMESSLPTNNKPN